MPLSQALNIIRQGTGTHFDPDLVPVFIEMIEEQGVIQFDRDPETQPSAAHAQEVTG
jgi:HD-GYP domain-containing protein (c-di-GMP phosphodiesterase class II)